MIYSHEVEKMCPVAQGVNHGAAPIPEEAKWVCSAAGCLQAYIKCKRRYHSGGTRRDAWMFRNDSFRSYGI